MAINLKRRESKMTNLYDRQKTLKLKIPKKVAVVGCGGIGYWVAKFLAMGGCENIHLYDPDVIEEHNLNRLDIPMRFIGKNKADVTKQAILALRDEATVYSYPFIFSDLESGYDWIVDCTDDSESQLKNQEIAKRLSARYFKAGYDGEGFGIHNTIAEWGESTNGYTVVPSWVVPAVMVASLAVAKIMKYHDSECISSVEKVFGFYR
jgi:molybdopterin/thiamine biosynthesis adenylyltransferase